MYDLSKRHLPTRDLLAEFCTFVPNSRDQRNFETDMRTLNPLTLRDSILECIEASRIAAVPYTEQRGLIHRVYVRKVKEFAAVYPAIYAVENALRSALADHLEKVIGRMDWWVLVRNAVAQGKGPETFDYEGGGRGSEPRSLIHGTITTRAFAKYIHHVLGELLQNKDHARRLLGPNRTDEFYYCLSLGELWKLIDLGWGITRGMFAADDDLGSQLTRKIFNDEMRVLKEARNRLFHSNPISNRVVVTQCAEKLLDYLDFHFGDYDLALSRAQYVRPAPVIVRTGRHALPGG
jgi:hypothetical protein